MAANLSSDESVCAREYSHPRKSDRAMQAMLDDHARDRAAGGRTTNRDGAGREAAGYPTTTLPHIPLHTPFTSEEWNRHRNLKTPVFWKVNDVCAPCPIVVFFDQAPFQEVTVWVPVTDFHTTLVPFATLTARGCHLNPDVVLTPLITTAA
jgi:hypothetical protein